MRLMEWNCKGLGGPSTIAQLKEAKSLYLPDIGFVSETKQKKGFVSIVCRGLRVKERWDVVNPSGRRGGLLVFWGDRIHVHQMVKTDFSIELKVDGEGFKGKCWVIFLYASTESSIRKLQWEILKDKRKT